MSRTSDEYRADEVSLIGTLRFVFAMGVAFAVAWLGMFLLLRNRW